MSIKKTLGGDRLGSGSRMKVELHNFERSTHDLGYLWRSTMAPGTLVPFLSEIALPGDTVDIDLDANVMTHPTVGPLFGSYKLQLDVFLTPIRLYNSLLHNNALGIGLNMSQVKLPTIEMTALVPSSGTLTDYADIDSLQINPSCLLNYLGMRGIGLNLALTPQPRTFNAIPILVYWDIYKNYYANKQEEIGAVIHTPAQPLINTVDDIEIDQIPYGSPITLPQAPATTSITVTTGTKVLVHYTPPAQAPIPAQIIVTTTTGQKNLDELCPGGFTDDGLGELTGYGISSSGTVVNWDYENDQTVNTGAPAIATFALENIDTMRNQILAYSSKIAAFEVGANSTTGGDISPYAWLNDITNGIPNTLSSQEGLGLKTYQSDLFNNWLQTEWIDGSTGINAITSIDTTGGSFTIDTLNLSKKVYDMLNRIAVSGGTYTDWINAAYAHESYNGCETPMYMGGMISEVIFQEVVSNSQTDEQPLGSLAGKGKKAPGQKGGHVTIKVDEPSYIMGIVSLTPRQDYSQGNKWDLGLQTLDDLHKPNLDEIGFQELITEQMAWFDTIYDPGVPGWVQKSAGKQPAWVNYMTNVNRTYGNFAMRDNEMFMTLNRRYEFGNVPSTGNGIIDLTTYIDPSKYNFIFAETQLDAQNFWVQLAVDITARRKLSAKVMPNL